MNKVWIVAKQVFSKTVKSWSFFWMVASPIVMMAVVAAIGYFISMDFAQSSIGNIAIVDAPVEIQQMIDSAETGNEINYSLSEQEASQHLKDGQIEGYLIYEPEELSLPYYREASSKDIELTQIQTIIESYARLQHAATLGISEQEFEDLRNINLHIERINLSYSDTGEVTEVSADDPAELAKTIVAYIVSMLVFFFIMYYMSIIAQEIASEKGSRIMEILLSKVSAKHHFIGKLLGISMVILLQALIYAVLIFIVTRFVDLYSFGMVSDFITVDIFESSKEVLWLAAIYSLLGIVIYGVLSGFFGSLVSKVEDVNKMIGPLTLVGLAGFYIGMYAMNSSNNPVVQIGSHIPFFTPFVMPFRIAAGTVSQTEIILSIVISIITAIIIVALSLELYKSNVLVYSEQGLIGTLKRSINLWKNERNSNKSIDLK